MEVLTLQQIVNLQNAQHKDTTKETGKKCRKSKKFLNEQGETMDFSSSQLITQND